MRVLQLHVWETTVQPRFVSCRNFTGCALRWLSHIQKQTAYHSMMLVYTRESDFQANLCEAFAEDKNAALLWRLSFGMGSFAKEWLQLLVNRISIETLEKLPTAFTWLYIDLLHKTYLSSLLVMSRQWWPTNKKDIFPRLLFACADCWMHRFVSHLVYLSLTKPTMQQRFHPSGKHLLYKYITPSFVGHSFRVKGETWYFFANSPLCILIKSQIYFPVVMQVQ